MFTGSHSHSIDDKGRLSVPAVYRMELARRSEKAPMLALDESWLEIHTHEDFAAEIDRLRKLPRKKPVMTLLRFKMTNSVEAPMDSQGRVLIPARLRERAGLGSKVVLAGSGSHIEIWNETAFETQDDSVFSSLADLKSEVAELEG